jgi:hypothetical protein
MKILKCLLLSLLWTGLWTGAGLLAADDQPAQPAPQPAAKPAKPAAKPAKPAAKPVKPVGLTVPAGAVQISPGLYRWTDKDGKGWMYRRTPFGVSRWEEDSEDTKQKAVVEQTTAMEQGDSVRFERVTPFGKHTWVKKKTELDETEQKIWARRQDNSAASRSAEKE